MRVSLDEINIWISKTDCFPNVGGPHSISWRLTLPQVREYFSYLWSQIKTWALLVLRPLDLYWKNTVSSSRSLAYWLMLQIFRLSLHNHVSQFFIIHTYIHPVSFVFLENTNTQTHKLILSKLPPLPSKHTVKDNLLYKFLGCTKSFNFLYRLEMHSHTFCKSFAFALPQNCFSYKLWALQRLSLIFSSCLFLIFSNTFAK